jgi:hypothetical protein
MRRRTSDAEVAKMIQAMGAPIDEVDAKVIVDYLKKELRRCDRVPVVINRRLSLLARNGPIRHKENEASCGQEDAWETSRESEAEDCDEEVYPKKAPATAGAACLDGDSHRGCNRRAGAWRYGGE